ncbi:MAG: hypothetical protein M3Y56_05795 [Armatimonadota bacterium]|nr:hypothetical protein [Armatimonadota bacterium]
MDLSKLETLKDKLVNAKQFIDIMTYFLDHFGENEEFMKLGTPESNKLLEQTLAHVIGSMVGKEVRMAALLPIRIPEAKFFHGSFQAKGGYGNFIYFEEIHMGLAAAHFKSYKGQTMFSRFSMMPMVEPRSPKSN